MSVGKILAAFVVGVALMASYDHIRPTMWGWVWRLEPVPDFHGTQLVRCPNGDLVLPPWHVRVLWDEQAPLRAFLQERGR